MCPRGGGGGGLLLGILGGCVTHVSPNSDPISVQKKSLFTPVFRPRLLKIHFKLAYFNFFLSFFNLVGTEIINIFIHFHSSLKNYTRFQAKIGKVYTCFNGYRLTLKNKMFQNPHPLGYTHLYGLYRGVPHPHPPPPPPPPPLGVCVLEPQI